MRQTQLFAPLMALLLGACATNIKPMAVAKISPSEAANSDAQGELVRWDGTVKGARAIDTGQCLEIVDYSNTHFLACGDAAGNADAYWPGRLVSVVGVIAKTQAYRMSLGDCARRPASESLHVSNTDGCTALFASLDIVAIKALPFASSLDTNRESAPNLSPGLANPGPTH